MRTEGVLGTGLMPGVFAQAGMEYAYEHDGVGFEQFAKVAEKNHAHSMLNPLAQYQKEFTLEEVMNAEMIALPEHAADVLPDRRRRGRGRARVASEKLQHARPTEQQQPGGEDLGVGAHHRPVDRATARCSPTSTRSPATPPTRPTRRPGVDPQDLDLVELHDCFATAELLHYENLGCASRAAPASSSTSGAPVARRQDPGQRHRAACSPRATRSAPPASPTSSRSSTHLRGEAGDRQIEGAKVGLTHVIGLGSACAVHVLERSAA